MDDVKPPSRRVEEDEDPIVERFDPELVSLRREPDLDVDERDALVGGPKSDTVRSSCESTELERRR